MNSKAEKGLYPGKYTSWHTIMIIAAVFYGLSFLQDVLVILSAHPIDIHLNGIVGALSSDMQEAISPAPDLWKVILVLAAEATVFILPVLAARGIYRRSRWGYWLGFASAVCTAAIAFIAIEYHSWMPHVILCVLILVRTIEGKAYLTRGEGAGKNAALTE